MINYKEIADSAHFLCVFYELKNDVVFKKFLKILEEIDKKNNFKEDIENYTNFLHELSKAQYNDFSLYVFDFIKKISNDVEKNNFENELEILNKIISISSCDIKNKLAHKYSKYKRLCTQLMEYSNNKKHFSLEDFSNFANIKNDIYENNNAFIYDNNCTIRPIKVSCDVKFSDLKGYIEQKRILSENTKALLNGSKVNNILLYGDAGCGKSSSVRALLNEFKDLKMVQIFKDNLINLGKIYIELEKLPYKFVIFADDISFDETDNVLSTMKAIMEGSLIKRPDNVVIYMTSNRRHLIKESFSARMGDEVHLKDTLNELSSLSERFGINLFFSKPTNDEFNKIVLELALDNNINLDEQSLIMKAQRYALSKGSRNPRVARQLIDNLANSVDV